MLCSRYIHHSPSEVDVMTEQVREEIHWNGNKAFMLYAPNIPNDHPEILHEFHAKSFDEECLINSTACWQRFISTWEIVDNSLFLKSVVGKYKISRPIAATWFSGTITIPQGRTLDCFSMSLHDLHESEIRIRIRKGQVVKEEIRVNCCGFFRRQFSRIPVIGKLVIKS